MTTPNPDTDPDPDPGINVWRPSDRASFVLLCWAQVGLAAVATVEGDRWWAVAFAGFALATRGVIAGGDRIERRMAAPGDRTRGDGGTTP